MWVGEGGFENGMIEPRLQPSERAIVSILGTGSFRVLVFR